MRCIYDIKENKRMHPMSEVLGLQGKRNGQALSSLCRKGAE